MSGRVVQSSGGLEPGKKRKTACVRVEMGEGVLVSGVSCSSGAPASLLWWWLGWPRQGTSCHCRLTHARPPAAAPASQARLLLPAAAAAAALPRGDSYLHTHTHAHTHPPTSLRCTCSLSQHVHLHHHHHRHHRRRTVYPVTPPPTALAA